MEVKVFYVSTYLSSQGDVPRTRPWGSVRETAKGAGLLCGSLALLGEVSALWIRIKPSSESKGGERRRGYDLALSFAVTFLELMLESPFRTFGAH